MSKAKILFTVLIPIAMWIFGYFTIDNPRIFWGVFAMITANNIEKRNVNE